MTALNLGKICAMTDASRVRVGVITGVGQSRTFRGASEEHIDTPYGAPSSAIRVGEWGGKTVAVLARRGDEEQLQPHLVPYRANIWAMASLGVQVLITTAASSGVRDVYPPGTFVVADQILDHTHGRPSTFYDQDRAVQVASASPFNPTLRGLAAEVLADRHLRFRDFGTIVTINGPRFATAAESRAHAILGADLSNMTLMPETALANELGMAVVNLSFITDYESGTTPDHSDAADLDAMRRRVLQAETTFRDVLADLIGRIPAGFSPHTTVPRDAIDAVLRRDVTQ